MIHRLVFDEFFAQKVEFLNFMKLGSKHLFTSFFFFFFRCR
jgi:hypothetical protein